MSLANHLIDKMVSSMRAKIEEKMPSVIDMFALGGADYVEVRYKGIIRRTTSEGGHCLNFTGTSHLTFVECHEPVEEKSIWKRIFRR